MQGFILPDITATKKCTLRLDSTQNIDKVPVSRVCQGQLLCKVSSSQLTLLQRNEIYFLTLIF